MISKSDLILILSEISEKYNVDTQKEIQKVLLSRQIPLDVVQFVNSKREFEINKFYNHIRKSYNSGKSKLYINIMREIEDVNEVLTTLSSLNLQILLYSKKVEDRQLFYKHSRSEEITKVLNIYFQTYDLTNCLRLLKLIKADILAFETISGKRVDI